MEKLKPGKKLKPIYYWAICFILFLFFQYIPSAAQGTDRLVPFDNRYIGPTVTPAPVTESFRIRKEVTGTESGTKEPFTFILEGDYGAPMPKLSSGKVAESVIIGSGTADFGEITFTVADVGKVYTYTVREVTGKETAILYDRRVHRIQVAVTVENNQVTPRIIVDGNTGNQEMVFINKTRGESEPGPGPLTIIEIFGEKSMPSTGFPTN